MTRREFLNQALQAGSILTLPALINACSSGIYRNFGSTDLDPLAGPEPKNSGALLLRLITAGITAPNPHNTQAWKFSIPSANSILLYVDEKRILPETDPTLRQIHIGQGAFIGTLMAAATQVGLKASLELFPEGSYAVTDTGRKPLAKLTLAKNTGAVDTLATAIGMRMTCRSTYFADASMVAFQAISSAAAPAHCKLHFLNSEDKTTALKKILIAAYSMETNTFRRNEENRKWFRFNDAEIQGKRDGISLRGNGFSGLKSRLASWFFISNTPESWNSEANRQAGIKNFSQAVHSSNSFVLFNTPQNTIKDWILCGIDYTRFQLAAALHGFVIHPMSQALQEYPEMNGVKMQFNETFLRDGKEKTQMIIRIGQSDFTYLSPRRNARSMLIGSS